MIQIRDLRTGYDGIEKLHGVSLDIGGGEMLAVIGPNGSGKSTMLKTAAGLMEPFSGQVLLDGEDIQKLPRRLLAQRVAYLPQNRSVPSITARKLVLHGRFPYLQYPRRYSQRDYEAADGAMRTMDISQFANTPLSSLSGGERQKVYIAMALAQETDVIIMDEPVSFLDIRHQLELMSVSRALADAGKTVLLVLHDLNLALTRCDRVAVMRDGLVCCAGTPDEVYESGVLDEVFGIRVVRVRAEGRETCYTFSEKSPEKRA